MQIEVVVKCMQTNFGGRSLSEFKDLAPFCLPSKMACKPILVGIASPVLEIWLLFICLQKRAKFPFRPAHGGQKMESAQKI